MRSKIILAIIVALLSGETLAADPLPNTKFSELSGIPASPLQLQMLGLSKLEGAGHAGFTPAPESWVDTYKGVPVNRHQLEVLGSQHKLAVATPASGISPCP
jgi:hypothetical protein